MKINKKDIFVLKTRSLIGVYYVSIDSVRGIIFIILLQTQWEIFFSDLWTVCQANFCLFFGIC